jgi:pimeloyl-ACP methyl ester carboxylesterase
VTDREVALALPDGRQLQAALRGDPAGRPVLSLHGSPGSRLTRYPHAEHLRRAGVLLVTYDRPGYGGSSPHPGRSVASCADDVVALLDHLGVERAVVGGSGGGPHALALAVLVPHRVTVVHAVVSLAPFDAFAAAGLDWYAGMDPENVRRFRAAERGLDAARAELGPDLDAIVRRMERDPATMLGPMRLPESDRELMRRNAVHAVDGVREAHRQGGEGFAEDFVAFTRPWGVDVRDAAAPVVLEYGALDVNVPGAHGDWLAGRLPHAEVRREDGSGHQAPMEEVLRRIVLASQHPGWPSQER